MDEMDIFFRMGAIAVLNDLHPLIRSASELEEQVVQYKAWIKSIPHERPRLDHPFKVGIYIRYFNQTKYDNYLDYHIKQYEDTLALCPKWTLVGFYIDHGSVAPNMESAPEWARLLDDCMAGKIDLIITQKVSNVSRHPYEINLCARLLAAQEHPIGIYFISEDIFTIASYYMADLRDTSFLPTPDWQILSDELETALDGGAE
jgi:hypothetical protein